MMSTANNPVSITIKRRHSIGDVISAHAAVAKYKQLNPDHSISYVVNPGQCMEVLEGSPYIDELLDFTKYKLRPTYDLDDYFERSNRFRNTHIIHFFCEQLGLANLNNLREEIFLTDDEIELGKRILSQYPKPWIMLGLRSKYAPERTYPDALWVKFKEAMGDFGGTLFSCGGPEEKPIPGTVNLVNFGTIRQYGAAVYNSDLVVCVDSSHLHIAQACHKPIVAIEMATDVSLRLLPQTDYSIVTSSLDCQYCFGKCPHNQMQPLCGNINPWMLYNSVYNKLSSITEDKVSALIPIYSPDQENISRCIESIKDQVDEVVVGFDGCDPSSVRLPSGCIIYHNSGKSIGYGKMMNELARLSSGKYLLLLNDDVFMDSGSIQSMKSTMISDVAIVGCRLRYPDGRTQHGGMQWVDGIESYIHIDRGKFSATIKQPTSMEVVTFASALMRRDAFYDAGCFDEDYSCYWEDVDLCKKIGQKWTIAYCPQATGIHVESVSTAKSGRSKQMWEHGRRIFFSKWRS